VSTGLLINFIIILPNGMLLGTGVLLCIENALRQARVRRENVNYVNAHATSTKVGDLKEY